MWNKTACGRCGLEFTKLFLEWPSFVERGEEEDICWHRCPGGCGNRIGHTQPCKAVRTESADSKAK